nr:tyrosine-type recombinase/integrase [Salinibacter ruber]
MTRPDKLPKVLTEAETDRLIQQPYCRYYGPHRDYLFIQLMLNAGLRASEAVSLRPEHVDLMSGKLMVREGKGAKDRTLWLGKKCSMNSGSGLIVARSRTGCSRLEREQRLLPPTSADQLSDTPRTQTLKK